MALVNDFFNKVQSELDAKYFPGLKYYRDNDKCAKLHYQTELFSNGCLTYKKYVNQVAKLCNDTKDNVKGIIDKYIMPIS